MPEDNNCICPVLRAKINFSYPTITATIKSYPTITATIKGGVIGRDGKDGSEIVAAEFIDNDIVFTKSNEETFVLEDARVILKGEPGGVGPAGRGVPEGGLAGQVVSKVSSQTEETEWRTISANEFDIKDLSDSTSLMEFWSNKMAATKITVGTEAPQSPNIGDLWIDTN